MDDRVMAAMWKGGTTPTSIPHQCPFRPDGADKASCIEDGGKNETFNNQCDGTYRDRMQFLSCNFVHRRCRVCVANGRHGLKANAVTDFKTRTCDEHKPGAADEPKAVRLPADPASKNRPPVSDGAAFASALEAVRQPVPPAPAAKPPTQQPPAAAKPAAPVQSPPAKEVALPGSIASGNGSRIARFHRNGQGWRWLGAEDPAQQAQAL